MLALPTRRQHHQTPAISSPSLSQQTYQPLPQQYPVPQLFDQKLLNDYLESQQQAFGNSIDVASGSYMTSVYPDYANPAIRVQQSTPTPQSQQTGFSQTPMLSANSNNTGLESWQSYSAMQAQSLQAPAQNQIKSHQRASSSSSVGSSASQYQAVGPSTSYQSFSNHLPTPTPTPTQDSFMNSSNYTNYTPTSGNMDQTMSAHMSMKQALMEQSDDVPDFAHSARQSVSSYGHDSPATPHTAQDELDYKIPTTGETFHKIDSWLFDKYCTYYPDLDSRPVPKFERTYTDIAADNFYDPSAVAAPPTSQSKPAQSSLLSPYRSNTTENVQRALQAAQYARSHSPTSTASRGDSPFRRGSPYRQPSSNFNSPMVGSAAAAREHTRRADAAYAMKSQMQSNEEAEVKTISPKDALLDYRENEEDSKVPLFPDSGANEYDGQYNGGDQYRNATQSSFDTSSQSYQRENWQTPQYSQNFPTASAPSLQQSTGFNFITPSSVQANLHALPLAATSQYRSTPSNMSSAVEQTPEFPAHLTSMESSASEAEPPNGSQNSVLSDRYLTKPASTGADSGTYSCTYHGCSQRFETPQKLQKHKREGHRNANLSNAMTSAAILERNSQAGPHKCERINPTTGKPCNTVFSRPYDLTRHEDTIHNGRKQKVRCALCVEDKTFSRNDALTRHMRVVHPEVDFPGKHRRRGGNHD
ncbi:hypothetical protein T440DRAFT_402252 [Plenodomus tracheiphilus IPT5]|uniref:C2H2-type domain-containing protein n=1 Tax=Plenodomus tracheiphilus IPT5 TaxID=1408161 RepID=A0A6A7AXW4_9PLEO|nr:hypothetical protein T440DRAFT_402252 [Plenodomus tracheiphilus IPT5]